LAQGSSLMAIGNLTGRPSSAGSARPSSKRLIGRRQSSVAFNAAAAAVCWPGVGSLSGHRFIHAPCDVDICDHGDRCCWRWLAHSILKETSWLKDELHKVRKDQGDRLAERAQVEHNTEAHAELRGTHAKMSCDLNEARAEICEFMRERTAMITNNATQAAREAEVEREIARLEEEKLRSCDRQDHANRRVQDSDALLASTLITLEELRQRLSQAEIAQALAAAQLAQVIKERSDLQKEKEAAAAAAEARRRKRNDRKPAMARGQFPGRSTSAPRPQFTDLPGSATR